MATRLPSLDFPEVNPWFRLAAGILQIAILDARRGDRSAQEWLISQDCFDLLTMLKAGVRPLEWKNWVISGCPKKREKGIEKVIYEY